jgi:hypothetical protein
VAARPRAASAGIRRRRKVARTSNNRLRMAISGTVHRPSAGRGTGHWVRTVAIFRQISRCVVVAESPNFRLIHIWSAVRQTRDAAEFDGVLVARCSRVGAGLRTRENGGIRQGGRRGGRGRSENSVLLPPHCLAGAWLSDYVGCSTSQVGWSRRSGPESIGILPVGGRRKGTCAHGCCWFGVDDA